MNIRKGVYPGNFVVHCDGGSRGNPGPAAVGVVIKDSKTNLIRTYGKSIGIKTNNEAEYEAVILCLQKIKQLIGKKASKQSGIEIFLDSKLLVSQLKKEFKITEPRLFPLFIKIWNLTIDFKKVAFAFVPREKNKQADQLVNEAFEKKENLPIF